MAALLVLLLAAWTNAAWGAGVSESFHTTGVSLNDVTKSVKDGQPVVFENSLLGSQEAYEFQLQLQNLGSKTVAVQSVVTNVYLGTLHDLVPDDAAPIATQPVQGKLPSLQPGQIWPGSGVLVSVPAPAPSTCEPWFNVTLVVNSTFIVMNQNNQNTESSQQELLPISISITCTAQAANSGRAPLQVAVSVPDHYSQTDQTDIPVLVDFGERLVEQDPLKLFSVSGADRVDAVYAVDAGQLHLLIHIREAHVARVVRVDVPAGVASNAAGTPNEAAWLEIYYEPLPQGWHVASYAMSGVLAGSTAVSWVTSLLTSCLHPSSTAGSLGYGTLGYLLWGQKFFATSLLGSPHLPALYRSIAEAFRWTSFSQRRPWTPATPDLSASNAFQPLSVVEVDSEGTMLEYSDGVGLGAAGGSSPSPAAASPQPADAPTGKSPAQQESPSNTSDRGAPATSSSPSPSPSPKPSPPPSAEPGSPKPQAPSPKPSGPSPPAAPSPSSSPSPPPSKPSPKPSSPVPSPSPSKGDAEDSKGSGTAEPSPPPTSTAPTPTKTPSPSPSPSPSTKPSPSPSTTPSPSPGDKELEGLLDGKGSIIDTLLSGAPKADDTAASVSTMDMLLGGGNKKRLLSVDGMGRALLQEDKSYVPLLSGNQRYVLASTGLAINPEEGDAGAPTMLTGSEAWAYASTIITASTPTTDHYETLFNIAFWAGGFLVAACAANFLCWIFYRWFSTNDVPGVLHAPRMQLVALMLVLVPLSQSGAGLFSDGLAAMFVGLAVLICFPLTFLLLAYLACTGPLCRKENVVYLVSRHASFKGSCTKLRGMATACMGMTGSRGKWKPADPNRRNSFVFRWGPLFEDCRGPPYTNRKPGATRSALQLMPSTVAEEQSEAEKRGMSRAVRMEDPASPFLCCLTLRRSHFQIHGTLMSLARLVGYALLIGLLSKQPTLQAVLLLVVAGVYLCYLRIVVPYSRPEEMALEYWAATLDVAVFALALVLSTLPGDAPSGANSLGMGMLALQCAGFAAYLANRAVTVVGAWREVVVPVSCWPKQKASYPTGPREPQRKPSMFLHDLQFGVGDGLATIEPSHTDPAECRKGLSDCSELDKGDRDRGSAGQEVMLEASCTVRAPPPIRVPARTAPGGSALDFPAIQEETESQLNTPVGAPDVSPLHTPPRRLTLGGSNPGSPSLASVQVHRTSTPVAGDQHRGEQPREEQGPVEAAWEARLDRSASVVGEAAESLHDSIHSSSSSLWERFWKSL